MFHDLQSLATEAGYAVADLFDDFEFEWFDSLPPTEKVRYRYLHADCDDFALVLHEITGWPVRAVFSADKGPQHRLVEGPGGRLLDASGWTTPQALASRYGVNQVGLGPAGDARLCDSILEPEQYGEVIAAMLVLETSPFSDELREAILDFEAEHCDNPDPQAFWDSPTL